MSTALAAAPIRFVLPDELSATEPPEARGVARDQVRLLVAGPDGVRHDRFRALGEYLRAGDMLVVNTSATLAAAVDGHRADGRPVTVHFATELDDGTWAVELRRPDATGPYWDGRIGERVVLPGGSVTVLGGYPDSAPHPSSPATESVAGPGLPVVGRAVSAQAAGALAGPGRLADGSAISGKSGGSLAGQRLWRAAVDVVGPVTGYLRRHGRPISYDYVRGSWPLSAYQPVFAREPGSAEMPSAGRPFTDALVTDLVGRGIAVAPILLHTGVSSPDAGEPPQPERFRVGAETARMVNAVRASGGRIVAVGTTVTRALESVADTDGTVRAGAGWTDLVLGADRPARVVTGLITGWHAPEASHLRLLEAVAGRDLVRTAYDAALTERYRWHEFGDSCLLLP